MIPHKWEDAKNFTEGLAPVRNDNFLWGYIDKTGEVVIPYTWSDAYCFSEGLAPVKGVKSKKYGFIDKTGKLVIPHKWEFLEFHNFHEGMAAVTFWCWFSKRWGFIDKSGKEVIPCKWKEARDFSNGIAEVMDENGQWHYFRPVMKSR